ncbi:hypothetical protein B005_3681 [Nocardiopsis alba ATCC BAA-2165]|uniref:Uncharacterized protein n=1 Tax=Nocardiopsis alba (strain ATCC BAA-2165 / BE74) TaxID=1205910 RepID=J7LBF4_NOCAA|nr:hypothetical protein B005_3681 [Nocardiopsis alba ATCC BAA-2165]
MEHRCHPPRALGILHRSPSFHASFEALSISLTSLTSTAHNDR